jgi:hypothetical protein
MNGIDLLRKFAKEEGIDPKRVDAFLNKFNNPQTLEELMELPHDMLKHFNYINDVDGPLYEYLKKRECHRHEVITLDDIADSILDNKYYYESKIEEGKVDNEEMPVIAEKLAKYEKIIKQLIQIKFGSIEYDW